MKKPFQFNGTSYVTSLPFVNNQTGNWFDVTPTGDETTDINIGLNCGFLLLKAISDDNKNGFDPIDPNAVMVLPYVLESIMKQDRETFKDVARGFFYLVDSLFQSISLKLKPEMDNHSYDELILENTPVIH